VAAGSALAALSAAGYAVERRLVRRWQAGPDDVAAAGLAVPDDVVRHDVTVSDGGRLHVVERGRGRPLVLVHGVTLQSAVWALQLQGLADRYRVLVVDQRGHGRSVAGTGGYLFDRLAEDLIEVLGALGVRDGLLVGHSMGGMVAQTAALDHPARLARHVTGLVLVATAADTFLRGPVGDRVRAASSAVSRLGLRLAADRGWGVFPHGDLATFTARASFGADPRPPEVELTRSMIAAMDPAVMAELTASLLDFSVADRLGGIDQPTAVVVGTHDLLTPPRAARVLAAGVPGASLSVLRGCGHMVMLERPDDLARAIDELARRAPSTR
jgi:pimeloyl-ACP methyl ester carboxylesterase